MGTNDATTTNTSKKIVDDFLILKSNLSKQLPSCRIETDHSTWWWKNKLSNTYVNKHLSALSECIENDNISSQHHGQKGLHLNPKGKGKLSLSFLKQIRKFWRSVEPLHESFLPFYLSGKIDDKVLRKSENLPS